MGTSSKSWKVPARKDEGERSFELAPAGNQPAVCVAVIDLGTQHRKKYQSAEYEDKRMLFLCWELVEATGRPLVGRDFFVSLHEKAGLRKFVEAWVGKIPDGQEFDLLSLAGKGCMLDVRHEAKGDKTFIRIEGATALPRIKGKVVEVDAPEHKPVALMVEDADDCPDWLPYLYGRPIHANAAHGDVPPTAWLDDAKESRQGDAGEAEDGDEYDPAESAKADGDIPF